MSFIYLDDASQTPAPPAAKSKFVYLDEAPKQDYQTVPLSKEYVEPSSVDQAGLEKPGWERSIETMADAAGTVGMAKLPFDLWSLGKVAAGPLKNIIAKGLGSTAEKAAFEAANATTKQAMELGPEGQSSLGRYMLNNPELISADKTKALKAAETLNKNAGKGIGAVRDTADLRAIAQGKPTPSVKDIETEVMRQYGGKYGSGVQSGEGAELQKALEELRKAAPIQTSSAGEELAVKLGEPTTSLEQVLTERPNPSFKGEPPTLQVPEAISGKVVGEIPNPNYVEPTLKESLTLPRSSYEDVRAAQEASGLPDEFPYLNDRPTLSELHNTATRLNDAAKTAASIQQPAGALTDVANTTARMAREGVEGVLSPTEKAAYQQLNKEFGQTENLQKFLSRAQARDATGSEIPFSNRAWYSKALNLAWKPERRAPAINALAEHLRTDPEAIKQFGPMLKDSVKRAGLAAALLSLQHQENPSQKP